LGDFVPSGKSYRFKCGLDGSHRAHAIRLANATPSRHLIDFVSNRFATDPANQRYVACASCNCIHSRRLDAQPCRASLVGGRPNVGHARTSSSWTLANPPRSDCRREPACLARPLILAAEGDAGAHATGLFFLHPVDQPIAEKRESRVRVLPRMFARDAASPRT
jgi:hypothetical protein